MTKIERTELADDLLRTDREIAKFVFGDEKYWRRVNHLRTTGRLPTFTLGTATVCARKSVLLALIEKQERETTTAKDGR